MKIAILGSRGIPNQYGGFEQFAEYLSLGLIGFGHDVYVYNSHKHSYQQKVWRGVNIIHCYDPEYRLGTAGQFIYDLNCILDSRNRKFDVILQLGYTSSSIWAWLLPKKPLIVTNMDGLEWKRTKYSKKTQFFLKFAEKWAVKSSHFLIADSLGIQKYIYGKFKKDSFYIPYGADPFDQADEKILKDYQVSAFAYYLLIARLEPENNIETILSGYLQANPKEPFLVIGNHQTKYGVFLKEKFRNENIRFLGAVYQIEILNNLRFFCKLYFHGHSVGGTNPSLLEAMACQSLIAAHKNDFNAAILNEDAYYFENDRDVVEMIRQKSNVEEVALKKEKNYAKIKELYNWEKIITSYESILKRCWQQSQA